MPDGTTLAASGRTARAPFAIVFEARDGRLVAHRGYWDMAGFAAQIAGAGA